MLLFYARSFILEALVKEIFNLRNHKFLRFVIHLFLSSFSLKFPKLGIRNLQNKFSLYLPKNWGGSWVSDMGLKYNLKI